MTTLDKKCSTPQRPSQSQPKRSRSKHLTFRQLEENIREDSWALRFDEVVGQVHRLAHLVMLAARNPVSHCFFFEQFVSDILGIRTCLSALDKRHSVLDQLRTWPQTPGVVFGEEIAQSALQLIYRVAGLIVYMCLPRAGSTSWNLMVGSATYRKWYEAARRDICKYVMPPADEYPDWQLTREWDALRRVFFDELRRSKTSPDANGEAAADSRVSRMTREEANAKVGDIIRTQGWPGSLRKMAVEVGCSHELVRGCPSAEEHIDRKQPRPNLDTTGEDVESVTDPAADPLEAMALREDLDTMLKELPAEQREKVEGATPQRQQELVEAWKSQKRDEKEDSRPKYDHRRQRV